MYIVYVVIKNFIYEISVIAEIFQQILLTNNIICVSNSEFKKFYFKYQFRVDSRNFISERQNKQKTVYIAVVVNDFKAISISLLSLTKCLSRI